MERFKQMGMKKALFTIAFVNTAIALVLSLLCILGCAKMRSWLAPEGVVIEVNSIEANSIEANSIEANSNPAAFAELPELTARAAALSDGITVVQILLPILIYMIALFATASIFYRLKLQEPLAALTKGASRIIENDLDFTLVNSAAKPPAGAAPQDELAQLCTAFETMRKTLLANHYELWRQAEERKRLNAAFSHNLRNPVTVLKGSAKLAGKSIAGGAANLPQLTENLLRIESYTDRIERYVETMGSIQKLEELTARREPTQWNSLACELENMIYFVRLDSPKQITFTAAPYPKDILIDKSILFQITENLVSNALRFAAHNIDISCSIADGRLSLSVADDGCGFPAKLIENGIQPFQKGNEDAEHFGMGLYTCALLSEKHGGGIMIRNTQIGASVSVTLAIG